MNQDRSALLYGLAAVLLWSTVATAFKLSLRQISPGELLLYACATATLLLAVILAIQGKLGRLRRMSRRQFVQAALLGVLNPCIYYLVLFAAYDRLPAQIAQPLNFTWALVLTYLSVPLLGHRLRRRDILAGVICYGGAVVIATGGDLSGFRLADPLGVALALGSTVIWALYWIANTRSSLDPVVGLFVNFVCALPLVFLVTAVVWGLRPLPTAGLLGAIYVGSAEMALAFVCWLTALRSTSSASRVANLIFIAPFLSLVFIHLFLGESIHATTAIGLVMIVAGLSLQRLGPRPKKAVNNG